MLLHNSTTPKLTQSQPSLTPSPPPLFLFLQAKDAARLVDWMIGITYLQSGRTTLPRHAECCQLAFVPMGQLLWNQGTIRNCRHL